MVYVKKTSKTLAVNFVERVELRLNPKVHEGQISI
jgi:hypothetical protein